MASGKKIIKRFSHGGKREGSGRKPDSGEMKKICVSVHGQNWNTALKRWKKKPSWLVDGLVLGYLKRGRAVLKRKAAT